TCPTRFHCLGAIGLRSPYQGQTKQFPRQVCPWRAKCSVMGPPRRHADVNAVVGGYLRDLAFAQPTQPQMFGYKRAAAAILALETPLTDLIAQGGRLPKIAGIGPGSARVIEEILETGG